MLGRFRRILDSCQPYLVTSTHGARAQEDAGLPLAISPELHFNPYQVRSGEFLSVVHRLDELTFGPAGMTMPPWVFYDCAEVPGGIFGFARHASDVPEWSLRALGVREGYDGPIPLSMYVAIPMLREGRWLTYTLCSLNQVAPGVAPAGILLLTEAIGLQLFGIEVAWGTAQWRSPMLGVHVRFGPLELVTAWTPAHSDPRSLTYHFPVTKERIDRALALSASVPPPETTRWLDCDEDREMKDLQQEIEDGRRFEIVGQPVVDGSYTRIPLREVNE